MKKIIILIIAAIVFVFVYYNYKSYIAQKSLANLKATVEKQNKKIFAPTPSPTPMPAFINVSAIHPNSKFYASYDLHTKEGKLSVSVIYNDPPADPGIWNPVKGTPAPERLDLTPFKYLIEEKADPSLYYLIKDSVPLAWANNKNQLAVFVPNEIRIYDIFPGSTHKTTGKLIKTISVPEMKIQENYAYLNLFYTGDDKKIFFSGEGKDYLYDFSSDSLKETPELAETQPYPIPNSPKIAFSEKNSIFIWNNGTIQEYPLPTAADYDYGVLFSPNGNYICMERGSSGSHWYEVFAFPAMRRIFASSDYGFCKNWRDGNNLVVKESAGYYYIYYNLNMLTGEKTVLVTENFPSSE